METRKEREIHDANSATRCWNKKLRKISKCAQKVDKSVFILKRMFIKMAPKSRNICAAFVMQKICGQKLSIIAQSCHTGCKKTTRWGHHVHEYGQSRASSEMTYGTNLLNLFNDNSFNDPSYNYCCIQLTIHNLTCL